MHEAALGKSILRIALEKNGNAPIQTVRVSIGGAHALEENQLFSAWKAMTTGTLAEGSELEVSRPLLLFQCRQCHNKFSPSEGLEWRCPECDSASLEIVGGREMEVISIILRSETNGDSGSNTDLGRE